ncbi:MAG: type II toxin-antitoxin system VapC family toxin [Archangium sp.]
MTFLVDANVLSEVTRPSPSERVVAWLRENEAQIVVDAVILGEVEYGILLLPRGRKRERLEAWFEAGVARLRCIPWDARTGRRWAQLLATLRARGKAMPIKDSFIAATALANDLIVVTRNRADFERAGVEVVDPFDAD